MDKDIAELCQYARHFSKLDEDKIATLHQLHEQISPHIPAVTEAFYAHLMTIPKALPYLEGKLESLKHTHQLWVEELYTTDYGEAYTQKLYHVGNVHVQVKLPVEFMAGAMIIIQSELMKVCETLFQDDVTQLNKANDAINSATGFSLLVMQESFQSSTLINELEKFLKITGMSRTLFNNLAKAYR